MAASLKHFRFSGQPTLELTLNDSHVTVLALRGVEEPHLEFRGDPNDVELTEREGLVTLHARDIKAKLFVPPQVRLTARHHDSKLIIENLAACDLNITGSDAVTELNRVHGRIVASSADGVIGGQGLSGTFDLRGTASEINVAIDYLDPGEHLVRSLMGTAKIDFAEGLQARLEMQATLGSARSSFKSVPSAPAVMRVEADVGSVRVTSNRRHRDLHGDYPSWQRVWLKTGAAVAQKVSVLLAAAEQHEQKMDLRRVLEMVRSGAMSAEEAKRLVNSMKGR